MQVRQVAWVQTFFLLSFDDAANNWPFVVAACTRDKRHLPLCLALQKLLYRVAGVHSAQLRVVSQNLLRNFAGHSVLHSGGSLLASNRFVPFWLLLGCLFSLRNPFDI